MEIATMPYVADAAPTPTPRVQGKESGGQGKSADSFADVMAGVSESTGQVAKPTEPAAKTTQTTKSAKNTKTDTTEPAESADKSEQAATATTVFAAQLPANVLSLLMAQVQPADGQATVVQTGQAGAVTGVQAVGADAGSQAQQPVLTALMAAVGETKDQGGQAASQNAGQQALPTLTSPAAVQGEQPAADGPQSGKAAAMPTGVQAPVVFVTAQPQATAQQSTQTQAMATAVGQQPTQTANMAETPALAAGSQQPTIVVPVQVTAVAAQTAKQPTTTDQPAATDTADQQTAGASVQTQATAPVQAAPAADSQDGGKTASGNSDQEKPATATTDQAPPTPIFAPILDRQPTISQPVHTTTEAAAPQTANDPYNVAGQIVDQAKLISRQDSSEMVIKLKPEHLGEVTMKITVDSGAVSATFHAANPEVRGAIEATLTQLRQEMTNQGLKVDYVGIYASLDQFFRGDQHQAPQQQQFKTAANNRRQEDEAFTEAVAAVGTQVQTDGSGGIDYRI